MAVRYEYLFLIARSKFDVGRIQNLLKNNNKSLIKVILHKTISAQMEQWYAKNPEDLAQRNQYLQTQKVETLNELCVRYWHKYCWIVGK